STRSSKPWNGLCPSASPARTSELFPACAFAASAPTARRSTATTAATAAGARARRTMAHGDTRIIPVELQESMYPYRLAEFSLREDSAGAGKFRGGLGFRKRYQILGACDLQAMFDRV